METKKSKYDTNPLDPDVERKAEDVWGDLGGVTQQVGGNTQQVGNTANENPKPQPVDDARQNVYSEAPTRRYDNPPLEQPYPSVFVPPTYAPPPAQYQSRQNIYQTPINSPSSSRPVLGIGIPEKWATMLAYVPGYIGLVVGLLELILVPRNEGKVRFHASQAVALHIAILIAQTLFGAINLLTGSSLGGSLFKLAAFIFLIISMIRVWKGEPHQITPLAEPAQWFNQHIEPRNRR
ncbi:MAG TPA: DUF4870 domain-containing protein [Pyrinomonadaceae bacterium]|nr:DUF4870 domain-containing protein [Pyrinomonadaceae bacterium]